jgi:nucleoside-diphosphate kinase
MALERTFSIIKPDAVAKNLVGKILARLEQGGLRVVASKMVQMTRAQAEAFYEIHKGRPFFNDLVEFMSSGPVVVQVLEGEKAVARNREIMGTTDPAKAAPGTIRREFGEKVNRNVVHGSDSPDTARAEIEFFFRPDEICAKGDNESSCGQNQSARAG